MTVWIIFCTILIAFVSEALIRAGYGAAFAAKISGWSMLAALVATLVPSMVSELDGKRQAHVIGPGENNAWTYKHDGYNWRSVTTARIMPTQRQELPRETASANNEPERVE